MLAIAEDNFVAEAARLSYFYVAGEYSEIPFFNDFVAALPNHLYQEFLIESEIKGQASLFGIENQTEIESIFGNQFKLNEFPLEMIAREWLSESNVAYYDAINRVMINTPLKGVW